MELFWDWEITRRHVFMVGVKGFLTYLKSKYPEMGLYSISTDWLGNRAYSAKVKGSRGDIIIRWRSDTYKCM
ncbi:hypothetical protein SAMN04489725_1164 [Alicyclobacillus hesperidum]|uniref:Uncharacterized protein n=1 Tax=Alicyclobacillus hesperidum TaxID=89784 RepID=A0A1H2WN96_9BACL|nr:hypothetical protein SAMN04489725_1164 [Alicyclobacillus hesperidum]